MKVVNKLEFILFFDISLTYVSPDVDNNDVIFIVDENGFEFSGDSFPQPLSALGILC